MKLAQFFTNTLNYMLLGAKSAATGDSRCRHKIYILYILLSLPPLAHAGWEIAPEHKDQIWDTKEEVRVAVSGDPKAEIAYRFSADRYLADCASGKVTLGSDGKGTIALKPRTPGFLTLEAECRGEKKLLGMAVSPYLIASSEDAPKDLDAFWAAQLKTLKGVPLDARLEEVPGKSDDKQTAYKLSLANVAGKRVYGWICVPKGAGPFPAILHLPSYGTQPISPDPWSAHLGALAITLSVHDYGVDESRSYPEYGKCGTNRKENFYLPVLLGCVQAVNYAFSRKDFDGRSLAVTGVSQGGGLALMLAGLDVRVTHLVQSAGAFCDHAGFLHERPSGFPAWVRNGKEAGQDTRKLAVELGYFDAAFFARRFKGVSFHAIGYVDPICPPATVMAAFNSIGGPKYLLHGRDKPHENHADWWGLRESFWRTFLPLRPPAQGSEAKLPKLVVGGPAKAKVKEALKLTGKLEGAGAGEFQFHWHSTSGPAEAQFESEKALASVVKFPKPGPYRLTLTADKGDLTLAAVLEVEARP